MRLMRPLLAFLLLVAASFAADAQSFLSSSSGAGGGGACPQGNSFADGCSGAPAGTARNPNLFTAAVTPHASAYAIRPGWNVPDTDYFVGIPSGTTLTDWQSLSATGCIGTVNTTTGLIEITSTPCTINGVDFSLHQASCIFISGSAGSGLVTVENSKFGVGTATACTGSYIISSGSGFTGAVTIIQNDCLCTDSNTQAMSGFTGLNTTGAVTIEYNHVFQIDQHCFDFSGGPPSSVTLKYNDCTDFGMQSGSHPAFTYFNGATYSNVTVAFNVSWERSGDAEAANGAQGITAHADSTSHSNLTDFVGQNNVVLCPGASAGSTCSYVLEATQDTGQTNTSPTYSSNYVDASGAFAGGALYPGTLSGTPVCSGNKDLVAGTTITGTFGSFTCN